MSKPQITEEKLIEDFVEKHRDCFDCSQHTFDDVINSIRSLLSFQATQIRDKVIKDIEERISVLTQGSGKTNKEMGDVYADTQHMQILELRNIIQTLKKNK